MSVGIHAHGESIGAEPGSRLRETCDLSELSSWTEPIRQVAGEARDTHVLMNNCHSDDAVTNARQLADLLSGVDAAVVSPGG